LSKADILVMDQHLPAAKQAGMSPEELQKQFPRLIIVSISLAGPGESARNLRYSDLVAHAISGIAFGTPSRVPDIETHPPLKPGGYQADYSCGLHAAIAALLGLQLRRRTDTGQLVHISALEMLASYMRIDIAYLTYGAATAATASGGDRQSPTGRFSTIWGLVPCKDGYYAFQASEQYQWASLMKTMGDPEWAKDPRYADPTNRTLLWDEIEPHVVEWSMAHSKADIFHTAQANHVPVFPCYTVEELINDRQQSARAFFTSLPDGEMDNLVRVPGAIVHLERTPWRPSFEPPAYGEHTAEVTRELESAG
jgi:formyl-CoA transferase